MRAEVRTSRLGLLLALLLVLVAPAMPGSVGAAPHSPAGGATVSTSSSAYDEQHDRPRGSVTAGHAPTTAAPDTWWVVWSPANSGTTHQARSSTRGIDSAATPAAVPTPWSSRAPPRA